MPSAGKGTTNLHPTSISARPVKGKCHADEDSRRGRRLLRATGNMPCRPHVAPGSAAEVDRVRPRGFRAAGPLFDSSRPGELLHSNTAPWA